MKKHAKTHDQVRQTTPSASGEKKFGFLYCGICQYHTSIPGNLTRHMAAKHSKELKVMCPAATCTAMFANKHSLKRHVVRDG